MEKLSIMFILGLTSMLANASGGIPPGNAEGQLIMACVAGAVLSAYISFRKARRAKNGKEEAFSAVIIALMSGIMLGYYGAPPIASIDHLANLVKIEALIGAILSLMGTQIVEFIASGHLGDFIKRVTNKRLGIGEKSD